MQVSLCTCHNTDSNHLHFSWYSIWNLVPSPTPSHSVYSNPSAVFVQPVWGSRRKNLKGEVVPRHAGNLEVLQSTEHALIPDKTDCQYLYFSRKLYCTVRIYYSHWSQKPFKAFVNALHYNQFTWPCFGTQHNHLSFTFSAGTPEGRNGRIQEGVCTDHASLTTCSVWCCSHVPSESIGKIRSLR